ncbi:MAG: hypothetical protein U0441_18930 [Polyangiaceae bacterium]
MIYAGTDLRVMATNDGGATWGASRRRTALLAGVLARVPRTSTRSLCAATFGRSAWETTFVPSLGVTPEQMEFLAVEGTDPVPQTLSLVDKELYGSELSAAAQATLPGSRRRARARRAAARGWTSR